MRNLPWISLIALGVIVVVAAAAPILPIADPLQTNIMDRFAGPSLAHPLGQDDTGRDTLSRLIWGMRASFFIAASSTLIACAIGTGMGIVAGYSRGVAQILSLRSMDVILCFPPLLLALFAISIFGTGPQTLIPILSLVFLPGFVRIAYAAVLTVRAQEYVEAMKVVGAPTRSILLGTILPNVSGPILVQFSITMATGVIMEAGLSFLGLGVVPPTPSLGQMVGAARSLMSQAPMLIVWPSLALILLCLVINSVCDGLRDWLDPKGLTRRRRRPADLGPPARDPAPDAVLQIEDLTIETPDGGRPVRDVSLTVRQGETVALVGESGSGKSLTSLAALGLLDESLAVAGGRVWVCGTAQAPGGRRAFARLRGKQVSMVFQTPMASLNPLHAIGRQIEEAITAHRSLSRAALRDEAIALIRRVGISDPERRHGQYPHELSGGMCQRVMIAMAIANSPRLLLADEPTTALDVTIQAQVLELLAELKRDAGLAMLFVSHSLPVVGNIADRVVVMYAGEVLEEASAEQIFDAPRHPYTRALMDSIPTRDNPMPEGIAGTVPNFHALPPGCSFAPRCALRQPACEAARPELRELAEGRRTRCLRWRDL